MHLNFTRKWDSFLLIHLWEIPVIIRVQFGWKEKFEALLKQKVNLFFTINSFIIEMYLIFAKTFKTNNIDI